MNNDKKTSVRRAVKIISRDPKTQETPDPSPTGAGHPAKLVLMQKTAIREHNNFRLGRLLRVDDGFKGKPARVTLSQIEGMNPRPR